MLLNQVPTSLCDPPCLLVPLNKVQEYRLEADQKALLSSPGILPEGRITFIKS